MVNGLPTWVWDMVMHLQLQELAHPKLYQSDGFGGYLESEWCPGESLKFVPQDIKDKADAISDYVSQKQIAGLPTVGE